MTWRRISSPSLADLLNYAHFVDDGIILNKDGAFLQSFRFHGPDIQSATDQELDTLTAQINRMLIQLEDGWMMHIDEVRIPSATYPSRGNFPNSVAALIDDERRQYYQAEGTHYENLQFLTLVWKFPASLMQTTRAWFEEGLANDTGQTSLTDLLYQFKATVARCINILRSQLVLTPLNDAELLSYLYSCISGELHTIEPPPAGCYLDVALGRQSLTGGFVPRLGSRHIYALSLTGYLNDTTTPGLLEEIGAYPLIYRWSNRFIPLSDTSATREMKRYQKNWNNKIKGLGGILKEAVSGKPNHKINQDAQKMYQEIDTAVTNNSNHSVRFGYWTSVIILIHEQLSLLDRASQTIREYLERNGFSCYQEDINALDAWLGSIPGHGSCNARRLFLHSLNLAHCLPLHRIWSGSQVNATASLLPAGSPPVFYAATVGKTPFRFYTDVGDVGHQMILGPTGSGKSTYLGFLVAQFLRYKQAQIFIFDKDFSHQALTAALGGNHYDLRSTDQALFCPLANLTSSLTQSRATQFIEHLALLQNVVLSPAMRNSIHQTVLALSDVIHINSRNLTVFRAQIQDTIIRAALQYYTLDGPMKLLDATRDTLSEGYLHTFEMGWLLKQPPAIYLPVLFYIFDQIESRLEAANAQWPTLIILEEAWLYIAHPLFSQKLRDWLKTLRKKNARVVFATQSLSDLYDPAQKTLTAVTATVLESCPTKIYLSNRQAEAEAKNLYEKIGLNQRQIEIITQVALPKQHYYVVTPDGNRLIELDFTNHSSVALAFTGLSMADSSSLLQHQKEYGAMWVYHWLKTRNLSQWADYWRENYYPEEGKQL